MCVKELRVAVFTEELHLLLVGSTKLQPKFTRPSTVFAVGNGGRGGGGGPPAAPERERPTTTTWVLFCSVALGRILTNS